MQPTYTVLKKDYTGCPDKQSLNGQLLTRLYSTRRSFVNFTQGFKDKFKSNQSNYILT